MIIKKILEALLYAIGALIALVFLIIFICTVSPWAHDMLSGVATNVSVMRIQRMAELEESAAASVTEAASTDASEEPRSEAKIYEEHMNNMKKGLHLDE
ncbi:MULTISPECIES: hypothetical protein [Butyrivibrio]|uniref:hypothetical protein n=1 Tax=Butyrivibrio TaxID=830 RepID=UPI0004192B24|nr:MULTISPECIES: hypothetical protein [Butyrivibrio]